MSRWDDDVVAWFEGPPKGMPSRGFLVSAVVFTYGLGAIDGVIILIGVVGLWWFHRVAKRTPR